MQVLHPASRFSSSPFENYDRAAAIVRHTLGVARLTPALANEVRAAVARHADRQARKAHRDPLANLMARLRERVRSETQAAVEPLMDRLFKMAQSSWAGGVTTDRVTIDPRPAAGGATSTVWSSNGKWSGKNLDRHVAVMPAWRKHVQGRGLAVLDGLLTTHAEPIHLTGDIETYRAAWVRQGRGYDLIAESGVIAYHRPSGTAYHAAGDDPAKAVRGLNRKLKAQAILTADRDAQRAERARKRQERQASQVARLVERLARWDLDEVADVVVTRSDSLVAGNCVPGTDQFIDRHFPGRSHATIGQIAAAVGRLDVAALKGDDLTLARQIGAACLVAVRRDRRAARLIHA